MIPGDTLSRPKVDDPWKYIKQIKSRAKFRNGSEPKVDVDFETNVDQKQIISGDIESRPKVDVD